MPAIAYQKRLSAHDGSYWTAAASPSRVREDLRSCALSGLKLAAIGGDQSGQFEQAFASLGYLYIKDKAPRLLDFIVGFQLVDRNEDNTKAIGVFGFKVGKEWYYAPTFFLNGDLKGHEMLYVKSQDRFVPLKENWINYLIARKPRMLGKASPRSTHEMGGLMPDLLRLTHPPIGAKYGSDRPGPVPHIAAWAVPSLPVLAAFQVKSAACFSHHQGLLARLDLRQTLADFGLLKYAYEALYMRYPGLKAGFDRFYGPSFFRTMAERNLEEASRPEPLVKLARSYILPPGQKKKSRFLVEAEKPKTKKGSLQIFVHDPVAGGASLVYKQGEEDASKNKVDIDAPGGESFNLPELDEAERERLLHDSVLIKDERDPHAVSEVYNTQVRTALANPDQNGIFSVLEKPGKFSEMLVITAPLSGRGHETFAVLVRKGDPRSWLNVHPSGIWIRQDLVGKDATATDSDREFTDYIDGLGGTDSLKKDGRYLIIDPRGGGTCPFRVTEDFGDGVYRVSWDDHARHGFDRPAGLPSIADDRYGYSNRYSSWDAVIRIAQTKGTRLRRTSNGELVVPEGCKVLELAAPPPPPKGEDLFSACSCHGVPDTGGSKAEPIEPGDLADIQLMLHEKQAAGELTPLAIQDLGADEIYLKTKKGGERMSHRSALISLVRDHGLGEGQARVLLKEAAAARQLGARVSYLVKYADDYTGLQPGPGAPAFPQPYYGTEQVGPYARQAIFPQEELQPVPGISSMLTDPSTYDPWHMPDQQSMTVAENAADSGQKEIFDTAAFSGMLKAVRQESLVDKHLGDLMDALDRLLRLLFMLFWHQEEFADRYGKSEIPELEDGLRNAAESLGDIVLYLKERSDMPESSLTSVGGGNTDTDTSEPSITEAARN